MSGNLYITLNYPTSMLTGHQIIHKIEQSRDQIGKFGVTKLILFGSYARDEAAAQSDIDFLVEFQEGRGLFDDCFELSEFLKKLFHKEVDLVKPALVRAELREDILGGVQIEAKV